MNWTQPLCDACWKADNPNREPVRVRAGFDREFCCQCGAAVKGIYIRTDPRSVPFPRA